MGMGGQRHAPAALPPRERPGTHCIGGCVGPRAGLYGCRKSHPPPGFDTRTFQPIGSRYTDWAIPALYLNIYILGANWKSQGSAPNNHSTVHFRVQVHAVKDIPWGGGMSPKSQASVNFTPLPPGEELWHPRDRRATGPVWTFWGSVPSLRRVSTSPSTGEELWYPWDRRLGGPQGLCERSGVESQVSGECQLHPHLWRTLAPMG